MLEITFSDFNQQQEAGNMTSCSSLYHYVAETHCQ